MHMPNDSFHFIFVQRHTFIFDNAMCVTHKNPQHHTHIGRSALNRMDYGWMRSVWLKITFPSGKYMKKNWRIRGGHDERIMKWKPTTTTTRLGREETCITRKVNKTVHFSNRMEFSSNKKTPMLYFDSILSKYDDDDSKTIDRDRERGKMSF